MNGYVEAGYVVGLGTLAGYAVSLVARERSARRRLAGGGVRQVVAPSASEPPAPRGEPSTVEKPVSPVADQPPRHLG